MRHFEHRIGAKTVGVVAVLVAGGDHQEAEADDVGESVRDLIRRTLVLDTACETIGDAQPCSTSRSPARLRAASRLRRPMTPPSRHGTKIALPNVGRYPL